MQLCFLSKSLSNFDLFRIDAKILHLETRFGKIHAFCFSRLEKHNAAKHVILRFPISRKINFADWIFTVPGAQTANIRGGGGAQTVKI